MSAADATANTAAAAEDEDLAVRTAAGLGMMSCHHCGTVWREVREHEHCQRCGTALHLRKPDSIRRSWAFLIAACIMYIPANLMPVMITKTLLGVQEDTIMSGVIYFWVSGAWELAAIIFIASFLVPLFKLASLILLTWTAQKRSRWRRLQRAKLYRLVEIIGRWSMLDVFVVSLLAGLVQIEGFAKITAGFGVLAFASVVVLTMLAALSFDPRLSWDSSDQEDMDENQRMKAQDE
ncbi:MAG: pqiA2 [Collimonas fungivorans]|uniref:paraquat-inducible protein A n=1 Tax=Collimonas fungivorans TaxID=158899 RepID=UPI0026F260B4|nr:paraquat-inducible protein A [Collimonas fungivorans]MDB5767521.1 pqiA2 [Collimonas fungivorans]